MMNSNGRITDSYKLRLKLRLYIRGAGIFLLVCFFCLNIYLSEDVNGAQLIHERVLETDGCPEPADSLWQAIGYSFGILYLFVAIAIVADEFFVPALDVISDWWGLSPDVAGATLMAAGASAPELFTNVVGTYFKSDVGFGAIVGSAVFNILFVIGVCSIVTDVAGNRITLTWWPMLRDSFFYVVSLLLLALFFGYISPMLIEPWEAVTLHGVYWVYVAMMMRNEQIYEYFFGSASSTAGSPAIETSMLLSPKTSVAPPIQAQKLPDQSQQSTCQSAISLSTKDRRVSLNNIMRRPSSFTGLAVDGGLAIASAYRGEVAEAFNEFDLDGNGSIDAGELKHVFGKLGVELDAAEISSIIDAVDSQGTGSISLDDFTVWYYASNTRLKQQEREAFEQLDYEGRGYIPLERVIPLMNALHRTNLPISTSDVVDSLRSRPRSVTSPSKGYLVAGENFVTFEEFSKWYENTPYYEERKKNVELAKEEAEGVSLSPPDSSEGPIAMLWYIITLPIMLAFWLTVPDVSKSGMAKYAYATFCICLVWMGIFSYYMVKWIEIVGATAHIPSVVMGLTFVAAGASVPDTISAIIVAKNGEGDKAVSSSIGSNVFDITVGLALPWILFGLGRGESIHVSADSLLVSILTLVASLAFMLIVVKAREWTLPASSGRLFVLCYFLYVLQQLIISPWGEC